MRRNPERIAFVVEEFALRAPAQQLLDRLLIGYLRDGQFHRPGFDRISICLDSSEVNSELQRRAQDFGLVVEPNLNRAVSDADAVVVVWKGRGVDANEERLRAVLGAMPGNAACFVYGALANRARSARELAGLADARSVVLGAGTSLAVTYRLPEVKLVPGARLSDAMIVVEGAFGEAELDALEGLLPLIERRRGGEAGVKSLRFLQGDELWRLTRGDPARALLASASSRSNTVQGDPLADGRTQDIVGLGLIEALARNPRGWLLEHRDNLRSTILVLDGAVADYNFAIRLANGSIVSAQLYRPPEPAQEQFSRLAGAIEDFFRTRSAPWALERSLLISELLGEFKKRRQ